jgi:hypothetical protein
MGRKQWTLLTGTALVDGSRSTGWKLPAVSDRRATPRAEQPAGSAER